MTFSALLPYLLVIGGYLLRHFDVVSKLLSLIGVAAGPNPLAPPSGPATPPPLPKIVPGNHPVLSDAVNAAIQQGINDALAGNVKSLRDELIVAVKAGIGAAVADLKAKG